MPDVVIREARLRPEHAQSYPEIEAGTWVSAAALARLVLEQELYRKVPGARIGGRPLPDEHFEFRGPSRPPEERPAGRSRETDVAVAEAEQELRSEEEEIRRKASDPTGPLLP